MRPRPPTARSLLFVLLALLAAWSASARALVLEGGAAPIVLSAAVEWLEDPSGRLTADDVRRPEVASRFQPLPAGVEVLNRGFTPSVHWLRLRLAAAPGAPGERLLVVPYRSLDVLDLHAPGRPAVETGLDRPLTSRPYFHRHFVFPVSLEHTEQTFLFRVASDDSLTVPVLAWEADAFRRYDAVEQLLHVGYLGGLAMLAALTALLGAMLRDRRFVVYACYAGAFGMAMFAGNGFGRLYAWPGEPGFDEVAQAAWLCVAAFFAVHLSRSFFRTGEHASRLDRVLRACGLAAITMAALHLASGPLRLPVSVLNQATVAIGLSIAVLVLAASVRFQLAGMHGARLFLAGWSMVWLGAVLAGLRMAGLVPTNGFTLHALQISSAIEMVLLALALADQVRVERRTRERAQAAALESNARMLAMLRATEERLEQQVAERTAQLEVALDEQRALHEQYVRFGSLIAHEFRNPLGIVESQLALLRKEHEQGLATAAGALRRLGIATGATRRLATMFDRWLLDDGLRRGGRPPVPRTFAIAPWLATAIDSNRHRFAEHRIETRVPAGAMVRADAEMLELAVTNLLENAARHSPADAPVEVVWRAAPGAVGIAVVDRGSGIAADLHGKVFEEFFRGNPEGTVRGLGIGLSIVRHVAEAHGGRVTLASGPGQGADVCIWLPSCGAEERA